ncbi:nicastrin-like [Diadema antillarum]|uniref:nicastrin-like n=2 Tax=Diadema antillarum TaxID=105358 RepID=UPI003A89231D
MATIMGQKQRIRCLQLALVFLFSVLSETAGQGTPRKTHDMIYYDIKNFAPCVRRFNATHQIGCTSDFNGNTGVIHVIEEEADLEWLLENGTYTPYIAVMSPVQFNIANVKRLLASEKLSGIMVDHSNPSEMIDQEEPFSPDKSCPNDNFGMYSNNSEYAHCAKVTWNPHGNGMSFMDFGIPVFALTNPKDVETVKECYINFSRPDAQGLPRPFPQCAGEMYDFMFGAKDTPTCIWRTKRTTNLETSLYCDPLGNYNVWATLRPTNNSEPLEEKSLIVAATQLDSTALFYQVLPGSGAETVVSGFVTLLAAVKALGDLPKDVKENMTNIMFSFFQGESYDYIGSSRMVYDMELGRFPAKPDEEKQQPSLVNLTTIAAFVELRQLALSSENSFYAHTDPVSQQYNDTKEVTSEILRLLEEMSATTSATVTNASQGQPLPPASFQQFLRSQPDIPGVVITDHDGGFQNLYYNSRLDLPEVFGVNYTNYNDTDELPIFPVAEQLADVATTLARTLYRLARPSATDAENITAEAELVNDLLFCFIQKPNCSRLRAVTTPSNAKLLSNKPYNFYVSVYGQALSPITHLVGQLLAYYTGDRQPMTEEESKTECKTAENDAIFNMEFVVGPNHNGSYGVCVKSTMQHSVALSPAFDPDNPDWGSTKYSTWTESQWSKYYVRIFLKPSRSQETVIFSVGMIILLVSLTSAYFISRNVDELFPQ